ncbi:MAG: fumarylacetoacetate hydrolase family protein, partial [Acidobacteriota bacterium]|nr:fumarylacetoacetate hydrolase family protein [Acidobacteriota bacterium]
FAGREDGFRFRIEPHRLTAPLLYPAHLLAAAANYRSHAAEMDVEQEVDPDRDAPYLFAKSPRSGIIGPGEPYRIPPGRDRIDWEGELGVVIGKTALRVPLEEALDHVFGYTVVFDVSDRGGRYRENPMLPGPDWFSGKSGDRAAPMGPYVTPAAFLPDPQALRLTTRIDDRVVQDDTTAAMIYSVAHLVAYASQIVTLHPGDVIATGTPDGVGSAREPPEFLSPGQTVHIEIEGIGTLSTPIEADTGS